MVIEEVEVSAEKRYVLWTFHLGQDTINIAIVKGGGGRGLAFFEDGVKAGAAAGERGIEGAVFVEGGLDLGQFGMELENGWLEIVLERVSPGCDRSGNDGGQRH